MAQVKSSRSFVGDPRGLGYHVRSGRKGADVITISDLVTVTYPSPCQVKLGLRPADQKFRGIIRKVCHRIHQLHRKLGLGAVLTLARGTRTGSTRGTAGTQS